MDMPLRLIGPSLLIAYTLAGAWSAAIAGAVLNHLEPVQAPPAPWVGR